MAEVLTGVNILRNFVSVANELSNLPIILNKKYHEIAKDLGDICKRLLTANEEMLRSLHNFRYYGWKNPDFEKKFTETLVDYKAAKGNAFYDWKAPCHDIWQIYHKPMGIKERILSWFEDQTKLEEIDGIIDRLATSDDAMIEFITNGLAVRIDNYLRIVEPLVDNNQFTDAEKRRLEFKHDSQDLAFLLEDVSKELTDLVLKFASITGVPLTL